MLRLENNQKEYETGHHKGKGEKMEATTWEGGRGHVGHGNPHCNREAWKGEGETAQRGSGEEG